MSNICECCTETEDLTVFHESYVRVFMSCFSIKMDNDGRKICIKCIRQLSDSYCFRLLVMKTQFALRECPAKIVKDDSIEKSKNDTLSEDNSFSEDDDKKLCYIKEELIVKNETANDKTKDRLLNRQDSFGFMLKQKDRNGIDNNVNKLAMRKIKVRRRGGYVHRSKQSVSKMLPNFLAITSEIPRKAIAMPKLSKEDDKCPVCEEIFPTNRLLVCHMNNHYCNFMCETCGKSFMSKQGLQIHMKAHTGTCKCEICDKELSSKVSLASHVHRHHRTEKRIYKCRVCDDRFMYFYAKMKHMETAHGVNERKFQCKICGLRFLTGSYMNKHAKKHNLARERRFSCEKCGAAYFDKTTLTNHLNSHTGDRPFQCTLCPKAYPRKFSLREHMRVHDNDKRFSCHICGRAFTQKCTLNGHLKTHEKEVHQSAGMENLYG